MHVQHASGGAGGSKGKFAKSSASKSIHEGLQASSNTVDGVASCLNAATKNPMPTHRITLAIHARTIQFGAEGAHDAWFTTPISCN